MEKYNVKGNIEIINNDVQWKDIQVGTYDLGINILEPIPGIIIQFFIYLMFLSL